MDLDFSRLKDTFFDEAAELLDGMEAALLRLEDSAADPELIGEVFRAAHSIKGSAGVFGFDSISQLTHTLENLLDQVRENRLTMTPEMITLLLRASDHLRALLRSARGESPEPDGLYELRAELDELALPTDTGAMSEETPTIGDVSTGVYRIRFVPATDIFRRGQDPLLILRDLARLGSVSEVQLDTSILPDFHEIEADLCYIGWTLLLQTSATFDAVRDVFLFVEDGSIIEIDAVATQAAQSEAVRTVDRPATHPETSTIRVSTAKLDKIIDVVGELVIAQSIASELTRELEGPGIAAVQEAMAHMERYTRELQERVMTARMLPIGSVFSRFPRLVRDKAAELGKHAVTEIEGDETELDKGMVERLIDPLTHIVRNSLDHGIESPEERLAAGKPEHAVIRLSARHEGGSVIVEVSDDGRGLDTARIREKAIEKSLIRAEDNLTTEQIHLLIFHPGFSTRDSVTSLSGRGVGMDVVKRNVEGLSGRVGILSRVGKGTLVRIKLPLTTAILDGLLLRAGMDTYVLPLAGIIESIRPNREQIREIAPGKDVVFVRGQPLPLLHLHRLFHLDGAITDPAEGLVVIVEHEGNHLGIVIDELLGQQQVVVKSLETHYRRTDGVLGATILGDGKVALILDIAGLTHLERGPLDLVA